MQKHTEVTSVLRAEGWWGLKPTAGQLAEKLHTGNTGHLSCPSKAVLHRLIQISWSSPSFVRLLWTALPPRDVPNVSQVSVAWKFRQHSRCFTIQLITANNVKSLGWGSPCQTSFHISLHFGTNKYTLNTILQTYTYIHLDHTSSACF